MNRPSLAWPTLLILCVTLSCGQSADPALPPSVPPPLTEGEAFAFPAGPLGQGELLLARYRVQLDPETLTLAVDPVEPHHTSQGPQGDVFDFDLGSAAEGAGFDPLRMWIPGAIEFDDGDVRMHFVHMHPLETPDIFGLPSASNRADLSYTARAVLLLGDSPGALHSFPGLIDSSTVAVVNTEVVINPDGYVHLDFTPGEDIVAQSGPRGQVPVPTPNVFPYVLLADEQKDNRDGISNGGVAPWGSYDVAAGGWQRANFFDPGWTGFDVIHAGQQTEVTLTLSGSALQQGPVALEIALLAKYAIPQHQIGPAGPGKSDSLWYRLPVEELTLFPGRGEDPGPAGNQVADLDHWFAYRMPHGALDVSQVVVENEPYIVRVGDPEFNVSLKVRDWDAVAPEAPASTPLYDPLAVGGVQPVPIDQVAPGTSWQITDINSQIPIASLVLDGQTVTFEDKIPPTPLASDTGRPGSELSYQFAINPSQLTLTDGGYFYGLTRVTDPENGLDLSASYSHQGILPGTLDVDGRTQEVINYQAVRFYACPQITSVQPTSVSCGQMTTFTALADMTLPPDATLTRDFGDGAQPQIANGPEPQVLITGEGGIEYFGVLTLQINSAPPGCRTMTFPFSYTPSQCADLALGFPNGPQFPDPASVTRGRYDMAVSNVGGVEVVTIAYFDDIDTTTGALDYWPHLVQINANGGANFAGPVLLPDFGTGPFAMNVSDIELAQFGNAWMVVVADSTDGEMFGNGASAVWATAGLNVNTGSNPAPYELLLSGEYTLNAPDGDIELLNRNGTALLLAGTTEGVNCTGGAIRCTEGLTAMQALAPGIPVNILGWNPPVVLDFYPEGSEPHSVAADWDQLTNRLVAAVGLTELNGPNHVLIYDNLDPSLPDQTPDKFPFAFNHIEGLSTEYAGGAEIRFSGSELYVAYTSPFTICTDPPGLNSGYVRIHHSAANPAIPATWQNYLLDQPAQVNCGECGYWEVDQQVAFEVLGGRPTLAYVRQTTDALPGGCPPAGPTAVIFRSCSPIPQSSCDWGTGTLLQDLNLPDASLDTEIALGYSPLQNFVSATLGADPMASGSVQLNWVDIGIAW